MNDRAQDRLPAAALLLPAPGLGWLSGDPRAAIAPLTAAATGGQGLTDPTAPLLAAVALAAWACTGWLLLVTALVGVGRFHNRMGRAALLLGSCLAPASIRTVVGLVVGVTVSGTVLTGPALANGPTPAPSATSTSQTALPSLDWPTTPAAPASQTAAPTIATRTATGTATGTASATASLAPSGPPTGLTTAGTSARAGHATPVWSTPPLLVDPGAAAAHGSGGSSDLPPRTALPWRAVDVPTSPRDGAPAPGAVVVRAGDSLWSIAAQDLGEAATPAQIAQAWPQWWQANRAVLGADPDLIHPGTSLTYPSR